MGLEPPPRRPESTPSTRVGEDERSMTNTSCPAACCRCMVSGVMRVTVALLRPGKALRAPCIAPAPSPTGRAAVKDWPLGGESKRPTVPLTEAFPATTLLEEKRTLG